MPDTLLQMPDLPARRKAVMHAEAVAIRAGQYAEAEPISISRASILLLLHGGWESARPTDGKMYLRWKEDRGVHPTSATGVILDFREATATSIEVKLLGDSQGYSVSKHILTEPGDEIRHHVVTDRILWRRAQGLGEVSVVELAKNPFAGWLDVALTVEGLKPQLALPPPGDDAA